MLEINVSALGRDLSVVQEQTSKTGKVKVAAELSCISLPMLKGHGRGSVAIAYKRWRVMWLLRQVGWTYAEIGRAISRDHASVMYGIKKFEAEIPQQGMAAE